MPLTLVAVPIGNLQDITLRALQTLKEADLVIGEERKPLFRLLKDLGLELPTHYELLNEHSSPDDVLRLSQLCKEQKVALVTDCGTPGFSDPGAELVARCRQQGIPVTSNPGPSSLTTFLSLCGVRLPQFDFVGFLPRDREDRERALRKLSTHSRPLLVMDTPYRLGKFLEDGLTHFAGWRAVIGLDLTKPEEEVLEGSFKELAHLLRGQKREFMALVFQKDAQRGSQKPGTKREPQKRTSSRSVHRPKS